MRDSSFFKMLADNSPLFVGMCDMNYRPFYLNDAGRRLVGLDDLTQFAQTPVSEYFFPEDQSFILNEFFPRVLREGRAATEIRFRHFKTGEAIWMNYDVFFLSQENGAPVGLATVSRDVTERKRAEEGLLWHTRKSELLSDAAAQLLASADPQRLVEELCSRVMAFLDCDVFFNYLVNESADRLDLNACGGISPEQAGGLAKLDFGVAVCGCVARDGQRLIAEDISRSSDQRTALVGSFGVQAYCCHPLMHHDKVIGTLSFGARSRARFSADEIAVMKAIADLVAIAMQRIQTEQELRAADRRKDEFLATLAHELRNPLAPIRNVAHVLKLKHGPQSPDAPLVNMVLRQVDHLVRLVDDLLEISRISRDKIELRNETVALSDVLLDALESCQPLIDQKAHRVSMLVAREPIWIFGDPVRLTQIAANLINNAAKYTPTGGVIEIVTMLEGESATLRVRDNGVGIAVDALPKVFDLFSQVNAQTGLSEGGLGIGLSLVRKLVDLHGGSIEAHSAGLGLGSEFVVRLPLGAAPRLAEPLAEKAKAASR